jgi:hypothetical protein
VDADASADQAALRVTGAAVVVFRQAGHGRINIVYGHRGGHIGWVDPPTLSGGSAH